MCPTRSLAPENPFPTAVDDAADAILYLVRNAAKLRIDPHRMATSGFSAGGNIAFTGPMRLWSHVESLRARRPADNSVPEYTLKAVASWYPVLDFTLPHDERRSRCSRPDLCLPPVLTTLFDASYLHPPDLDLEDPFLSPSRASARLLMDAVPSRVVLYTCEYDMLLYEGEQFAKRLAANPIAKNVRYKMVEGVVHNWDKLPNPLKPAPKSEELYLECCELLKAALGP